MTPTPAPTEPKTVLLVQRYDDGGSMVSLLGLVRTLDPKRYRPVVALRSPSRFTADLEAMGVPVEIMRPGPAPAPTPLPPLVDRSGPERRRPWWQVLRRELRRTLRNDLPAARWLRDVARRHEVDLVHANNDPRSNRASALMAAVERRPLVLHIRNLQDLPRDLALWLDRGAAARARRVICIARAVEERYLELLPIHGRTVVVDNPIEVEVADAPAPPTLRADLGLAEGTPLVLAVGRLVRWKGQDVLVRAMAEVVEQHPAATVLFAGAPTGFRGAEFADEVAGLAASLGIADRVRFLGHRRDVGALLAVADVVVHCSVQPEPFGRVVAEAMAAGRPVIASRAGGVVEVVDDGSTGLLVPPGRPDDLARRIVEVLDDPVGSAAMGERARLAVRDRFGEARHAARVQEVWDDALRAAPRRCRRRRPA